MTTQDTDTTWDFLPQSVRRRDLRAGPPFRDPPKIRLGCAVLLDLVLHLVGTLLIAAAWGLSFLPGVAVFVAVSFLHRVLLRWWWGATLGGLVFGLRFAVEKTGRVPTFGELVKTWLFVGFFAVLSVVSG